MEGLEGVTIRLMGQGHGPVKAMLGTSVTRRFTVQGMEEEVLGDMTMVLTLAQVGEMGQVENLEVRAGRQDLKVVAQLVAQL